MKHGIVYDCDDCVFKSNGGGGFRTCCSAVEETHVKKLFAFFLFEAVELCNKTSNI